jgi:hypothetical protein
MSIAVMKQALEALESVFEGESRGAEYWTVNGGTYEAVTCMQAIRSLRQAIEQVERQFNPDWNQQAVLVERIRELEAELAKPEQEPVTWGTLNKLAQTIVKEKYLFKRFIDGTPLANDIAVWMTEFALEYAAPPRKPWVGLTDKEMESLVIQAREVPIEIPCDSFTTRLLKLAEAKLKEKNT